MKPFTLEEYLKNQFRKIITRDGREAKILYTEAEHEYPIIALITNEDGTQFPRAFNKNGEYFHGTNSASDLFFSDVKHEAWVNVYRDTKGYVIIGSNAFASKEQAVEFAKGNKSCIDTVKIEWKD